MKKLILFSLLIMIAAGGVFAQVKYDGSKKNTVFFGPVMAGYERTLFRGFSAGAEAGLDFFAIRTYDSAFMIMPVFLDAFARWYPWQRIFFVNLGLGYQSGGINASDDDNAGIFHIKPQAGWKIDIGEAGGWIFEARAGFGMTVGGEGGMVTITVPVLLGRTF
jgi:hypothetical protein